MRTFTMRVVMLHTSDYLPAQVSVPVVASYCGRWRYSFDYHPHTLSEQFVPAWNKIHALQKSMRAAHEGEWLIWIDADVLLLRFDVGLDTFVQTEKALIFSTDSHGLCTGFFLIRNCVEMDTFLSQLWSDYTPDWPWEQGIIAKAIAGSTALQSMSAYIPESVVQNPKANFNPGAFAMHYWAYSCGQMKALESMRLVRRDGWTAGVLSSRAT